MPTSKEQKKKNQEIEKKIRIALIDFTMKTNQACKSKVESEFASEAFGTASYLVDTILELKDGHKMGAMYNRMSDYLSYKKFQNECNKGNRYFLSCDSICKLFNDLLEIVEKNDPLRIGNFEFKIYSDVKKNVDKILKHSDILEKREDVLIERCRKCLEFILNKKKINEKIKEKIISWLERICIIRFGDKAKWPKNKTEGLAGLAKILIGNKELKFKFKSIINHISKNVNNRSCLWPLVENSGEVGKLLSIFNNADRHVAPNFKKIYGNILGICNNFKKLDNEDVKNLDVVVIFKNLDKKIQKAPILSHWQNAAVIRNKDYQDIFRDIELPTVKGSSDLLGYIATFNRFLTTEQKGDKLEDWLRIFFGICDALNVSLDDKSSIEANVFKPIRDLYQRKKNLTRANEDKK